MLGNHLLGIHEKAIDSELTWERRFERAKSLGFDFVEIAIDEKDDRINRLYWSDEQTHRFNRMRDEQGIGVQSMCLCAHRRFPFGSAEPAIREKATEIMRLAVEFANATGIRVIQLVGYDVYYEESTEQSGAAFLDGLRYACELAARYQVMLAMEIMDTPFLNSITKNLWYRDQLDSAWYSTYPDLGNLSAWGHDVIEELNRGKSDIVAVHLKDTLAITDMFDGLFRGVRFGMGCVDFAKCFLTLEKNKFYGPYVVDMCHRGGDDVKEIQKALDFIQGKYTQAMDRMSD